MAWSASVVDYFSGHVKRQLQTTEKKSLTQKVLIWREEQCIDRIGFGLKLAKRLLDITLLRCRLFADGLVLSDRLLHRRREVVGVRVGEWGQVRGDVRQVTPLVTYLRGRCAGLSSGWADGKDGHLYAFPIL